MNVNIENTAGMNSRTRKLTDTDVRDLLRRWQDGESREALAQRFKVCRVHVNRIIRRQSWQCLDNEASNGQT